MDLAVTNANIVSPIIKSGQNTVKSNSIIEVDKFLLSLKKT